MKHEADLAKAILLEVQNGPSGGIRSADIKISGYTEEQVADHVRSLIEEGLLTGTDVQFHGGLSAYIALRLTPRGRKAVSEPE